MKRFTRRQSVIALAALLGGCGFQPVYGPKADGKTGPALAGLSQTSVALIPERSGQVLRQFLQDRFERNGSGGARLYELVVVGYSVTSEPISYQQDSNPTRVRLTARANWSLLTLDAQRLTLTSGVVHSTDGYNMIDQQFFYDDLANDAALKRMGEAVADQIALQLASYFNHRAAAG